MSLTTREGAGLETIPLISPETGPKLFTMLRRATNDITVYLYQSDTASNVISTSSAHLLNKT